MEIRFDRVVHKYGDVLALGDVTASVDGRIIAILGPNASGKTTLLKILAGLISPGAGTVFLGGKTLAPGRKSWLSFLPQETGFFPLMQRPSETLSLSLRLRGISDREAVLQLLSAVGLEETNQPMAELSGGTKQKVRIAQALVHAPQVLILDEPTTGLDIHERYRVLRLLERLRDHVVVVFSTHDPEDAAVICDQVLLLHKGKVIRYGSPGEITEEAQDKVFEFTVESSALPFSNSYSVVRADRVGALVRIRAVGIPPHGCQLVSPRFQDAYLLLTRQDPP